ncbi:MAG: EAL domain-containing protein, partial [Acidocella sp.]|nr:EAL domain-containing protein [Acidocella sp.]
VSVLSIAFVCNAQADVLVAGLIKAFEQPVRCAGIPIQSRVGIGLVAFNRDNVVVSLRTALSAAQDSRNNDAGWAGYDRLSDDAHRRSFQLLSDLPAALEGRNQLSLVYQPKINFKTGACCGVEALLRWVHPWLGPISPGEFIPMVESTALIGPMTEWVIRQAARQLGAWSAQGVGLNMAVNVSPHNLAQGGFMQLVTSILDAAKIDPCRLELEFTEGMLVNHDARVVRTLQSLRDTGVRIALDDFGTGFSNLSYLTSMPADILKLDQSFIRKICTDASTALLVRTFSELAQKLGYVVVAEGIEDAESYELLRSWGCDEGQGYFMSKPLAAARVLPWLAGSLPAR